MDKSIHTRIVFCNAKQRYVEISHKQEGPWYSQTNTLVSCPAQSDPGQSCDQECLRKATPPTGSRYIRHSDFPWL